MNELTLMLVRFGYLAILWIFVLSALSVIRSDMFGARMPEGARQAAAKRQRYDDRKMPGARARENGRSQLLPHPRPPSADLKAFRISFCFTRESGSLTSCENTTASWTMDFTEPSINRSPAFTT